MLAEGQKYRVEDGVGRVWGVVTIKIVENSVAHGYLSPTIEFEEIMQLFREHDRFMSSIGSLETDSTSEIIAKLNVQLIPEDGEMLLKPSAIFVNENYLLSFRVEQSDFARQ